MGRKPSRFNGKHAGQAPDGDLTTIAMSGALVMGPLSAKIMLTRTPEGGPR
jgi:hypothetical protein